MTAPGWWDSTVRYADGSVIVAHKCLGCGLVLPQPDPKHKCAVSAAGESWDPKSEAELAGDKPGKKDR